MAKPDLRWAFGSFNNSRAFFEYLMGILKDADPAVVVLALEGLYRIESDVKSGQFPQLHGQEPTIERIQHFLRQLRCEWQLKYSGAANRVSKILRSITIFKTLEVPLFIDDYGEKQLLSSYEEKIEDIAINGATQIYHVTHLEQAESINNVQQFTPSDNKNIIKGCWFGLDNAKSVYGSKAFQTTLSELRVTGLRQGEIVCYKHEVNVILYAVDDANVNFEGLKKPTDDIVREEDPNAYVNVSIFVPARFLPEPDRFGDVVRGPLNVEHGPFCVQLKRKTIQECRELQE